MAHVDSLTRLVFLLGYGFSLCYQEGPKLVARPEKRPSRTPRNVQEMSKHAIHEG